MNFFQKYKVIIIGLLLSAIGPVNDLIQTGETSVKVLVVAGIGGVISFAAYSFRGQWQTIAGILQLSMGTYITQMQTGTVSWGQIVIQAVMAYLAVAIGPVKSRGYEHTPTIVEAKREGNVIQKKS